MRSQPALTEAPWLDALLAAQGHDPLRLLPVLRGVQAREGWIAPAHMTHIAAALGLPRGRVEGVASFYHLLATEPRGRYRVLFSDNITDVMAGSRALEQRLRDAFGLAGEEVSRDGLLSVARTSCTGLCDQGPALLVNNRALGALTAERIGALSALVRGQVPLERWPAELFSVRSIVHARDLLLGPSGELAPGAAVRAAVGYGGDGAGFLDELARAGLRGRGGAGFATATKWRACRAAEAPEGRRYVVCNADEGEPGTFKDRVLLDERFELLLEGMTLAAYAVGAQRGFVYLRGEYEFLVPALEAKLAARRAQGALGARALPGGEPFDVELYLGAGAYVCGEESALLESLEGKRGIPRNRPPYPVTHGYLGAPTVVNNVETFCAAALVAAHGAGLWRSRGTASSTGTKLHSVSGDVARPGVYELPFGCTVRAVLERCGGEGAQAVLVGGPSGTLLAPHEFDRRVAFEDVPTAGAFVVFDERRDMLEVAVHFARFFAHESCGFCTPCRVGTTVATRVLDRVSEGHGTRRSVDDLVRVEGLLRGASHCGLGYTAANVTRDVLAKFRPSVERRLRSEVALPSFDLDAALAPARELTGRDDPAAHLALVEGEPHEPADPAHDAPEPR